MTQHSLKALRQEFKNQGKFYTPPELAEFLKSLIPGQPTEVYDPTCGAGNLLAVFGDQVAKFGQDIDPEAIKYANELPNFTGHVGDVFTDPAFMDRKFTAIVANPPFSIKWEQQGDERFFGLPTIPTASRADFAFLIHIWYMLADGGTAAVLNFPGVMYRGGREQQLREWLVEENAVDQVIHIPGDTFTDTAISTVCLVLKKNRTGDTIRFIDQEHDLTRDVPIQEIRDNEFTLSVSTYVQPEVVKDPVDPVELEYAARRHFLKQLRRDLHMSKFAADQEPELEFQDFVDQIHSVINEFTTIDLTQPTRPDGLVAARETGLEGGQGGHGKGVCDLPPTPPERIREILGGTQ